MTKRLLFILTTMCVALSGFALSVGEYVYTPTGRFLITSQNVASSNFADFTGWTVVSATAEKTFEQAFNINFDGYAEGMNSVSSVDNSVAGEGISFTFVPGDAGKTYVVSYKLKGTATTSIRVKEVAVSTNLVKINGVAAEEGVEPVVVNTAEQLSEDWQTFNYAIQGDGTYRTYYISFTGMASNIEIADLQIAEASQVADLRQRDAMLEKLNVYKNCYEWNQSLLDDYAINEIIEMLNGIGDNSSQDELDEYLGYSTEILDEFLKQNMDDYLAGGTKEYNYLGIGVDKMQKVSTIGVWNCLPAARAFWTIGDYVDLGHYQSGTWNFGSVDEPMGVYMQKSLDAGSYVFGIEAKAAVREPKRNEWNNDDGMKPAYGVAYIVKMVDGEPVDTLISVVKDLESANFTSFYVPAKIIEEGTYEIGFKAYCKDEYKSLNQGSVTYVRNASLWGKNDNEYNQRQLAYEADVREQIVTGRTQLTTAEEYIADKEYYWGKNELQACVDSIAPRIAAYEAMSQDDIIATYEEDYEKSLYSEVGYMVCDVYQEAVKYIITANKKFVEVNETLNSIQPVIDNAEKTLALRLYDAATGKDDLQAAIASAKELQMQMRAADYCAENAAIIARAIQTLNAAVETFKTTIPESAKQTLVDIDFEQDAVYDDWTGYYRIPGIVGAMEFDHFATETPEYNDIPYEKGLWSNGEHVWSGYLRVGNGTGTVTFDPTSGTSGVMGTNILKVSCDFYIQGLSGRYIGFTLKNEEDETLAGLCRNYYNGIDTENTFDVDMSYVWAKSGPTYNDASPADAEVPTANPLQKTHFEVVMDYGTMTMYCSIASPNGSTISEPVEFSGVPTQFVLQSNYNITNTRRCWFDNLKIEKYLAGGAVIVDDTWTVAGAEALCGVSWDPAETSNNMTTKDGVNYTLAKDNIVLEAGVSYQYKVVANHSWDECYPYDDNASFTVEENGLYSVRFYFNSEYKDISVEYWKIGEAVIPEKTWTIAGVQALMGSAWMNDDSNNDMTALGDGAFQLVKKNVELMADVEYEFKVVANHSWSENYGMNGEAGGRNCFFTVDEDGVYDVTFVWIYDTKELYAFAECASGNVDTNYMYANDGQVLQKGTTSQLAISMLNDESVLAFQFDVVLPDGLSLAYTLDDDFEEVPVLKYTNRGLSSHVIAAEYQYDGSLRIAGYSSKNAAYRYNDGELLTFGINVEDWVADGNYTVTLKNVLITNAEGVENHASNRTFTVKVGGLKGDANNDSQVTMSDVVAVANNVLGRPSLNFNFNNADVNSDGEISIGDVVGVVNIVLGRTVAGSRGAESTSALVPGTLTLKAEADRMSVKLDNTAAYTAFQMDVTLPEGMSLNDAVFTGRQTSSHSLLMSELENGKVRIAGWSVRNDELKGNSGELLSLVLSGAQTVGTVTIDNIRFVTAEGVEHAFACVEAFDETTGIGLTPALSEGEGVVYDLQGRKVNRKTLKGLYILDGKKSVKK